jgi:urease accessory protein
MLTLRERVAAPTETEVVLTLPFELRQKSRLATTLPDGEPVALMLERGAVLRGGDCLRADDGRHARIVAADEDVMDACSSDAHILARIAYHLGNRHAPVEIGDGFVRFAADTVLAAMVEGLGACVTARRAPFEPELGAYGGRHTHHSGEARHTGVIHDMLERQRNP